MLRVWDGFEISEVQVPQLYGGAYLHRHLGLLLLPLLPHLWQADLHNRKMISNSKLAKEDNDSILTNTSTP